MGPAIYTVEQLLALRPLKPNFSSVNPDDNSRTQARMGTYLAVFRKYTALCNEGPTRLDDYQPIVAHKYDFFLSNKEFKRRWVKSHGTSAGLKDLPRRTVIVRSIRVKYMEDYFRRLGRMEKLLEKLRHRIVRESDPVKGPSKVPKYIPPVLRQKSVRSVNPRKSDIVKYRLNPGVKPGHFFANEIGGVSRELPPSFNPPPAGKWVKYWYYYRKRGFWRTSEHHPYGDEFG